MNRAYPKVLHLIANLQIGGTEGQLVGFANRATEPMRHHVACFYSLGPLSEAFPTRPIWLGRIGRRPDDVIGNVRVLRTLRRTVVEGGFDLVHAHLGLSEVIAAMVTPRRIPIVASRRGRNRGFETGRVLKLIEGIAHRRVDVLICNSAYLADLTRFEDRWPPPIRVIHNAVDLGRFTSTPLPPEDPPTVVVVANLHAYKGHERFLRAMATVRKHLPDVRATLVGEGVEGPRLARLARGLGLGGAVVFAGEVADPRPIVERAQVVALTSDSEGFPNALLEAMAMGRPVVATRVGGIPELVRDREDGFLVGPEPGESAERLIEMLRDAKLRERMGRSARVRAESFTWDRVVQQTEGVYQDVLRRRGRS